MRRTSKVVPQRMARQEVLISHLKNAGFVLHSSDDLNARPGGQTGGTNVK